MKKNILFIPAVIFLIGLMIVTCSSPTAPVADNPYDPDGDAYIPTADINTAPVTGIRALRAESGGQFETDYGKPVTAKGVCWSTEEEPTLEDDCTNDGQGHDTFTSVMSGLEPDQVYYLRAYATNEDSTVYGGQREFRTMDGKPDLRTHPAQEVRSYSARVSGEVHSDGGAALLRWGLCYAEDPAPTTSDHCLNAGGGDSQKPARDTDGLLSGFEAGDDKWGSHRRQSPGDFSGMGTVQGSDWSTGMPDGHSTAPGSAHQSLFGSGSQESPGRQSMKDSSQDTKSMHADSDELTFSMLLEGLTPDQIYYVRTFAVNEAGASYGPEVSFTTRDGLAVLTTTEPSDVTAFSAKTGGEITDDGGADITVRGVCYVAGSDEPDLSDTCLESGNGTGSFEVLLEDLSPNQQYSVRAYATTQAGTGWGQGHSFGTTEGLAVLSTAEPGSVWAFSVVVGGQVSDEGDAPVTERGICLSTNPVPDLEDRCEALGSGEGSFETTIEDLGPATKYHVRAYATNAAGTAWGQEREFTTRDGIAILTTTEPFDVTAFSAKTGGEISDDGGAAITARGVCYVSGSGEPGLSDTCLESGSGTGSFEVLLEDLSPNQQYSVRAYATTQAGTGWGQTHSFTTTEGLPVLITAEPGSVRAFSAVVGGQISDQGDAPVTERGICLSTSPVPDLEDRCEALGSGVGSFETTIEDLGPATKYHVRAYATNAAGTAWGQEREFTTRDGIAVLTTTEPFDVTAFSTKAGGEITDDGGADISVRGVCYVSGSGEPGLSDTCLESGSGTGSFEVLLEDLSPDQRYSIRAYATTNAGTAWGQEREFTTRDAIAVLTTTEPFEVTAFSAKTGGEISDDGGAAITARGVCYVSGSGEPGLSDTCLESGSGTGSFEVLLEDLDPDQQYTVRAYATNSQGTSYGEQRSFTTLQLSSPTVTTSPVSNITHNSASTGGNVTSSGGATVTQRGVCYSTSQNPTKSSTCVSSGSGTGSFTSNLSGLSPSTTYYVRAYATNSQGTGYGEQRSFTTSQQLSSPTVTTSSVTSITHNSASTGGNVTSSGGATVTQRGVCYSTSQNPTTSSTCVSSGSGTGSFTSNLSGLSPSTTYYVRAYATNSQGTGYGEQRSFTTLQQPSDDWPRDTETTVVEVTSPTGRVWMDRNLGASRAATSSTDSQAYGDLYQWGRAADGHQKRNSPTTTTLSSTDQPGHGSFILSPDFDTYRRDWRSPQNNNLWQGVNGTNNPCPAGYRLPTEAEWNAERSSWSSNNASGAFGSPLKLPMTGARDRSSGSLFAVGPLGYYWSSTVSGSDARLLLFVSSDAGMDGYNRAYGHSVRCLKDEVPQAVVPTVTTSSVTSITHNSASTGGNVTSSGGATVTQRGVCYSTSQNPTTSSTCVSSGSGTGSFTSNLSGLSPSTTYYVRAYATNSQGTSYGEQRSFTTFDWPRDTQTTVVGVTSPTGRVWMDRNLGASRAAASSTDSQAYGDLYQWGRAADGHQRRNSQTTSTLSSADQPSHGSFILAPNSPYDWRSPQNNNLWQGVSGVNNPCPPGYRLPTEAEWNAERNSWSSSNASGAFNSPLKLPMAGFRNFSSGSLYVVGSNGNYWSGTVSGSNARLLFFDSNFAGMGSNYRALGYSVRCLKDE